MFIVRLIPNDSRKNFFESILESQPELIEVDHFYAENLDKGNFFGRFKNPQEYASKMNITIA